MTTQVCTFDTHSKRSSAAAYIIEGELEGHPVRKARKEYWCDGWSELRNHARILPGDYYVEGFCDIDKAGGFGHDRYCLACVGSITVDRAHVQKIIEAQQEVSS